MTNGSVFGNIIKRLKALGEEAADWHGKRNSKEWKKSVDKRLRI